MPHLKILTACTALTLGIVACGQGPISSAALTPTAPAAKGPAGGAAGAPGHPRAQDCGEQGCGEEQMITDWVETWDDEQDTPYLNEIDMNTETMPDEFDNQPGEPEPCQDSCDDSQALRAQGFPSFPNPFENPVHVTSTNPGKGGKEQFSGQLRNMSNAPQTMSRQLTTQVNPSVTGGINAGPIMASVGAAPKTVSTTVTVTVPANSTLNVYTYATGIYSSGYEVGWGNTRAHFTVFAPGGTGFRVSPK